MMDGLQIPLRDIRPLGSLFWLTFLGMWDGVLQYAYYVTTNATYHSFPYVIGCLGR